MPMPMPMPMPRPWSAMACLLALCARAWAEPTVTWFDLDPVQHDVRSGSPEVPTSTFNSGLLDRSDSYAFVFEDPAQYEYYCSTHAKQMRGALIEVVAP